MPAKEARKLLDVCGDSCALIFIIFVIMYFIVFIKIIIIISIVYLFFIIFLPHVPYVLLFFAIASCKAGKEKRGSRWAPLCHTLLPGGWI